MLKRAVVLRRLVVMACSLLIVSAAAHAADEPLAGTWTLNRAKSKMTTPLKDQTLTFEPAGNGVKLTIVSVDAEGKTVKGGYTATYDGKDVPFSGNPYGADTIALKRVDAHTTEATWKKAGAVIIRSRRVVSNDGRTLTITNKGNTGDGKPLDDVVVFDKR